MALLRPVPWTSQPQVPVRIDWSNPITRGLKLTIGANGGFNVSPVIAKKTRVKSNGVAAAFDGSGDQYTVPLINPITLGSRFTLFSLAGCTSVSAIAPPIWALRNGGSSATICYKIFNSSFFGVDIRSGAIDTPSNIAFTTTGKIVPVFAKYDGTTLSMGCDGAIYSVAKTITDASYTQIDVLSKTYASDLPSPGSDLLLGIVWTRDLSDTEINSISANPWQIFKPITRRLFALVAAGGGVSITGNLGTATASGLTASLTQAASLVTVLGTATASGLSATLAQAFNLSANRGTATASGAQATVAQVATISASLGTATASGLTAGITAAGNVTISCNLGTATAAGRQANIVANVTVSSSRGAAIAAGYTAALEVAYTLASNLGTASATGNTATIYASDVISASMGQGIASGYAALIVAGEIYARAPSGSGPVIIKSASSRPINSGGIRR